ncbi:MAG: LexA family transcriptional regulator [Hydrogenophaga sp.]|nr:LexA family transcriptional regulator [Hydrogenophaga sp.]
MNNYQKGSTELPFAGCAQKIVTMNTNQAQPEQGGTEPSSIEPAKVLVAEEPVAWYLHHAAAASEKNELKAARTEAKGSYMRRFGERCKTARGVREIGDVAERLGLHRNTIYNFERGMALPDAFELEVIAQLYGTSAAYLLEGDHQEKAKGPDAVRKGLEAVQIDGFIYVPLFDINVSAGSGAFNDVEAVTAMRPFDANYIRYELGISHNQIAMTSVVGRSMEPWLRPKDTVLTDLKDREALTEGVHIVRLDGALLVKNLQRLPGKVLRVSSYNQAYEPFDIQGTEDRDRDFQVIGRVRWAGVTFS